MAVIGLAGRFPGAPNAEEFWRNLCCGIESIRRFDAAELRAAGVAPALAAHSHHVPAGGVLEDADLCDAALFQLTPREASLLDPQHRLMLECAWEALEDAGCDPARFRGPIGVFAGTGLNGYLLHNLLPGGELPAVGADPAVAIANEKDFLATRISYKLNLTGPSLDVQTACSTSLVAVVLACQSLLNYQCDLALAGGVAVREPQRGGYLYQEHGILSPDGHCRPFDAAARGTVPGSGAGLVVLRRLEDALADRDAVRAVIRGAALNNDGASKVGYTAPSVRGQAEVIGLALAIAGVRPRDLSFVEAHGTGTPLGDPIELRALDRVFRADTAERGFCTLGAVKSNLGHLDAAAGVTGLIKTVLALERRQLPPTLHFTAPNPEIDLAATAFRINGTLEPWDTSRLPRRAGVSSFGIGGTNAHVVLEEAPGGAAPEASSAASGGGAEGTAAAPAGGESGESAGGPARDSEPPPELLILSARSPEALDAMTARLAAHLRQRPELRLADVARTLRLGRRQLAARRILVARGLDDAASALAASEPGRVLSARRAASDHAPEVAFLFPGQGAQHAGMAADLYRREPVFRRELETCCGLLRPHLETDLLPLLSQGGAGGGAAGEGGEGAGGERLAATELAQPALFAVEYALARLWISWGVRPAACLGHSVGEYVAACLAGVMPLDRALELVARRGRLMRSLPPGAMLAVPLGEAEVAPLLGADLSLAAVNAPDRVVAAGAPEAIARLAGELAARGVGTRPLPVGHAFHSPEVAALLPAWAAEMARTPLATPRIPYVSTLTGTWATAGQATSAAAWAEHLRAPAQLARGLAELLADPGRVLLEVGPGQGLASLARRQRIGAVTAGAGVPGAATADASGAASAGSGAAGAGGPRAILASLPARGGGPGDAAFLLGTLGRLWLAGVEIDWAAVHPDRGRRVPLPTYPFERQRYWIAPPAAGRGVPVAEVARAAGGQAEEVEGEEGAPAGSHREPELGRPFWRPALPRRAAGPPVPEGWLLLLDPADPADRIGCGARLAQRLREPRPGQPAPRALTVGIPGPRFARLSEGTYSFDPLAAADHDALLAAATAAAGGGPLAVVHLLGAAPLPAARPAATPLPAAWLVAAPPASPRPGTLPPPGAAPMPWPTPPGAAPMPVPPPGAAPPAEEAAAPAAGDAALALRSLAELAAALDRRAGSGAVRVEVVAAGAVELATGDGPAPERAALRGLCEALAAEHPGIGWRLIDVVPPSGAVVPRQERRWLDRLLAEIGAPAERAGGATAERAGVPAGRGEETPPSPAVVALRGRQRWTESWEPLPSAAWSAEAPAVTDLPAARPPDRPMECLVAGDPAGLGADLAAALAGQVGARVAVVAAPHAVHFAPPPLASPPQDLAPHVPPPAGTGAGNGAAAPAWPDEEWLAGREAALRTGHHLQALKPPQSRGAAGGSPPSAPGAAAPAGAGSDTAALDALCTAAIARYLVDGGVRVERGAEVAWEELRRRLRLVPRGERLLLRLLSFLEEDGVVAMTDAGGGGGEAVGAVARTGAGHAGRADRAVRGSGEGIGARTAVGDDGAGGDAAKRGVRFLRGAAELGTVAERRRTLEAAWPHLAGVGELIDHCAAHYPRALSGGIEGLEVLYPGGSPALLERAMRSGAEAAAADPAPLLLRELLAEAARRRAAASGRNGAGTVPLRILEVGAGQGMLTRELLPGLDGLPVDYHWTDIGRGFVLRAEERAAAAGQSGLRFGVLDIARDPVAQGFPAAGYDAVLGANVVHATPRIAETLGHLASLLAPGGLLALVETVRQRRWGDMVWGLTDGWWGFADTGLRQLSPLLDAAQWVDQLGRAGLAAAGAWPRAAATRGQSDAALLLAWRPALDATVSVSGGSLPAAETVVWAAGGADAWKDGLPGGLTGAAALAEQLARLPRPPGLYVLCSAGPGPRPYLEALAERLAEREDVAGACCVSLHAQEGGAEALGGALARLVSAWRRGEPLPPALVLRPPAPPVAERTAAPVSAGDGAAADRARETASTTDTGTASLHARPQLLVPFTAPRDAAEERVAAIWSRCLGLAPVGVHDNFLELGGDSLTGLRVMREIGEAFGLDGHGLSLFETPTVATIAAALGGGAGGVDGDGGEALIARRESRGQRRREQRQGARRTS